VNILFIPHSPNLDLINRVYEFAKNTNSYFLYWEMDNSSLKHKIISQLNSLKYKIDDDRLVQIPLLFRPEKLATQINTYTLNNVIEKLKIDVVVNANALLFDIKKIAVPVIYDLVDDHLEVNRDIGLNVSRIQKIKEDIVHAKGVICVSSFLEEKVKQLNKNTITIENGLYLERFEKAKGLKKELGLEDKKVYGYIGGVASWTGVAKACENYMKIKDTTNAFIIVGENDSKYYKDMYEMYRNDIIFIGKVPPHKVADYFKTLDVGLIPFEINDFTNNALPIKALEYALGGANVIATKLRYLEYKEYPFIEFCIIENFYKFMQDNDTADWKYDFSKYDWKSLSDDVTAFIKRSI